MATMNNVRPMPVSASTTISQSHKHQKKLDRFDFFLNGLGLRALRSYLHKHYFNREPEPRKPVILNDRLGAFLRCWIHIVPVVVTIAITTLSFSGYFIGAQLEGSPDKHDQQAYQLLLQVAAKIMELLIIASLGTILMDAVRYDLLFTEGGIPFGMLMSRFSFSEIQYFWSPEFLYGSCGFKNIWVRWAWRFTLALFGLIAVLAGPATAVAFIPEYHNDWPAGGSEFRLNGSAADLWPTSLGASHAGGDACAHPSAQVIKTDFMNNSGCAWQGFDQIASFYAARHLNNVASANITVTEGKSARSHQVYATRFKPPATDSWALGTNSAVSFASQKITAAWRNTVDYHLVSKLSLATERLGFRTEYESIAKVVTQLPTVRVKCNHVVNGIADSLANVELPFPYLPVNASGDGVPSYKFNTTVNGNISDITTQWLSPPVSNTTTLEDGGKTSMAPSTFLLVVSPTGKNRDFLDLYPCTVDARWAPGYDVQKYAAEGGYHEGEISESGPGLSKFTQPGELYELFDPKLSFRPPPNGSWRQISMRQDWLDIATPPLDGAFASPAKTTNTSRRGNSAIGPVNGTGGAWTTLSYVLSRMGASNSTGFLGSDQASNTDNVRIDIEGATAATLVDALSRIAYRSNGGDLSTWADATPSTASVAKMPNFSSRVLSGTATYPNYFTGPHNPRGMTQLRWTVTVSGLAFTAGGTSRRLALALLLLHALLAAAHMAFSILRGRPSDAWDDKTGLLLLAHQSAPAQHMENTCVGAYSGETMQTAVRVRAAGPDTAAPWRNGEEMQMLLGDECKEKELGLDRVKYDQQYGAVYGVV